ncbi:MAG: divergent polysaccharide deacetylase family protein [Gammaproteobacteria bacterium]|nr:divergent polysaccharide deacetylase family protein [Gammaproteobacteria bacterium]
MWLVLFGLSALPAQAQQPAPVISIIIDDLGNHWRSAERSLALPGQVTLAILPHTPYSVRLATRAHASGREIMLHLPMASIHQHRPGPGAVNVAMDEKEFDDIVAANLEAVPYISGVNNHMGSQVTPSTRHMDWLMTRLERRGNLYFVDSRTTASSVAAVLSQEKGLPTLKRDIFLDHRRDRASIHKQFQRLLRLSEQRGWAVAIGHPYPETLAMLEAELPKLAARGIELVPVSRLIREHREQGPVLWQASLSPLQQDSKNSKQ